MNGTRDHGGALDAATALFGGRHQDWLDLSTGVNPKAYPIGDLTGTDWTALPDAAANERLLTAARVFWNVPEGAEIIAAPGASSLIARLPYLMPAGLVDIEERTYNEHDAAFVAAGWKRASNGADVRVIVHPNNPDGRLLSRDELAVDHAKLVIIDESFCDCLPAASHVAETTKPGVITLKSFGKFWGLAGLRLGFAIGHAETVGALRNMLGPWPVSGPALRIGARALGDPKWAASMRAHLGKEAARLDALMCGHGAAIVGGTPLFRLFEVANAASLYRRLAEHHILARIFPYSATWVRLGLPSSDHDWQRLERAMQGAA